MIIWIFFGMSGTRRWWIWGWNTEFSWSCNPYCRYIRCEISQCYHQFGGFLKWRVPRINHPSFRFGFSPNQRSIGVAPGLDGPLRVPPRFPEGRLLKLKRPFFWRERPPNQIWMIFQGVHPLFWTSAMIPKETSGMIQLCSSSSCYFGPFFWSSETMQTFFGWKMRSAHHTFQIGTT